MFFLCVCVCVCVCVCRDIGVDSDVADEVFITYSSFFVFSKKWEHKAGVRKVLFSTVYSRGLWIQLLENNYETLFTTNKNLINQSNKYKAQSPN
jgi:CII-binding regulator of phage lambda lysogenization HflD